MMVMLMMMAMVLWWWWWWSWSWWWRYDSDDGGHFPQDCALCLLGILRVRNKNRGHFYTRRAINFYNIGDPLLIRKGIMLSPKISISKPGIYSLPMGERKKLTDLASDHHLCVGVPLTILITITISTITIQYHHPLSTPLPSFKTCLGSVVPLAMFAR